MFLVTKKCMQEEIWGIGDQVVSTDAAGLTHLLCEAEHNAPVTAIEHLF